MIQTKADLLEILRTAKTRDRDRAWPNWKKKIWDERMDVAISAIELLPDGYQQEVPN
jgi:hypothetical protein